MTRTILVTALSLFSCLSLQGEEAISTDVKIVENYMLRIQKEVELRMGPGLFSSPVSEDQSQWDTIWSFRLLYQSSKTIAAEVAIIQSVIDANNQIMIAQYSEFLKLRSFDQMRFSHTKIQERLDSVRSKRDEKGIAHYEGCLKKIADWLAEHNLVPEVPKKAEQDGSGQPATQSEANSEGGDKPQPEAEGRSR